MPQTQPDAVTSPPESADIVVSAGIEDLCLGVRPSVRPYLRSARVLQPTRSSGAIDAASFDVGPGMDCRDRAAAETVPVTC